MNTMIKKPTGAWYFSQLQPSGTLFAVEPDGTEHVVKEGDMNRQAGVVLLNAMITALAGKGPVDQQPNEWREAVLDWLAPTGKDFPADTPPREIVKWLMDFEHGAAQQQVDDEDERCPTCGEDGGTSCGMPNCGLLTQPQAEAAPAPDLAHLIVARLERAGRPAEAGLIKRVFIDGEHD